MPPDLVLADVRLIRKPYAVLLAPSALHHRQCRRGRSGDKASRRIAGGADCGWQRLLGGGGRVERSAASAWAAFARGETVPALSAMREAADSEDRQEKHIMTSGWIFPARELLADMLMEAGSRRRRWRSTRNVPARP